MTWSLSLKDGDLAVDGRGHSLAVVRDEGKLLQDLKSALLHRQGEDPTTPSYGSLLEGGTTPNGVRSSGFIGQNIDQMLLLEIEEEVRRVLVRHQTSQVVRAKSDEATYGRITLSRGEILLNIGQITAEQTLEEPTRLSINIYLQTGSGSTVPVRMLFS